jgi:DNA-binding winged helix-turn-helix (wHTH) protein
MAMQLLDRPIYLVEGFEVDPMHMCVRRADEEYPLRQKTFQALLYLLEHHERLVTKEELIQTIWDGAAVTDDALVQIIVELRKVFGDDSRQPRFIRTVPKVGYHFIAPVSQAHPARETALVEIDEVTTVQVEIERTIDPPPPTLLPTRQGLWHRLAASPRQRAALFAAFGLMVVLTAGWFWLRRAGEPANVTLPRAPGKKPVAVMYFENRASDRELDWLREGLADMLIASLSRSQRLTLLSRQQLTALFSHIGHSSTAQIKLAD